MLLELLVQLDLRVQQETQDLQDQLDLQEIPGLKVQLVILELLVHILQELA